MTKEEFIVYVKAIIDMEIEVAKRTNPIFPKDERYKDLSERLISYGINFIQALVRLQH